MLARLRALPEHAQTPAVLMSAHLPRAEVDGLLAAGFGAFLSKPFTCERLCAVLAGLIGGAIEGRAAEVHDGAAQGAQRPGAGKEADGEAGEEAGGITPWVDVDFLRGEAAALGPEVLDRILAVFRSQGDGLVQALRGAAVAGDAEQCRLLAHKLRGAASNVGLRRLGEVAAQLEQEIAMIAVAGELDARARALADAYARTLGSLDAWRAGSVAP